MSHSGVGGYFFRVLLFKKVTVIYGWWWGGFQHCYIMRYNSGWGGGKTQALCNAM